MSSTATQATVRYTGTVKWFSPEKGFGFITPDAPVPNHNGDVFVHANHVAESGGLAGGQRVSFAVAVRKGKNQAESVRSA